jgi:uncharacterized protein YjiS (DUF1127 family)
MSRHSMQGWAVFSRAVVEVEALNHQSGSSTPRGRRRYTPLFWIERSRQRRRLGELAELNDHLLRDIGVSRDEALREAAKPFWR